MIFWNPIPVDSMNEHKIKKAILFGPEGTLEYFKIEKYFDSTAGASLDGKRNQKADVIGARMADMPCVAVSYGYGTMEELKASGAGKIVHTVKKLQEYLLHGNT